MNFQTAHHMLTTEFTPSYEEEEEDGRILTFSIDHNTDLEIICLYDGTKYQHGYIMMTVVRYYRHSKPSEKAIWRGTCPDSVRVKWLMDNWEQIGIWKQ
jgi:hypothetical protein